METVLIILGIIAFAWIGGIVLGIISGIGSSVSNYLKDKNDCKSVLETIYQIDPSKYNQSILIFDRKEEYSIRQILLKDPEGISPEFDILFMFSLQNSFIEIVNSEGFKYKANFTQDSLIEGYNSLISKIFEDLSEFSQNVNKEKIPEIELPFEELKQYVERFNENWSTVGLDVFYNQKIIENKNKLKIRVVSGFQKHKGFLEFSMDFQPFFVNSDQKREEFQRNYEGLIYADILSVKIGEDRMYFLSDRNKKNNQIIRWIKSLMILN